MDSISLSAASPVLTDVVAEQDWLVEHLNDADVRIIEVDVSRAAYDEGHIPGAVHVHADLLRTSYGTFENTAVLRQIFNERGVVPECSVVTYCTIGIRASEAAFVLRYLLGYPDVCVYAGSWAEWGTRTDTPIEI